MSCKLSMQKYKAILFMSCKLSNYSNNFCKLILRILHSRIKKILSDKIIMRVASAYKNTVRNEII